VVVPTRILSLFSGLGGLDDLGVALALPGARVVCAVERCAYCAAALAQRMEQGHLPEAPIWDDVRTFDGTAWRGAVDIVTAGYPCQGFSVAGKRGGEGDPRYLWPEVARVVGECRPAFVFVENVARHLSHGFERVAGELQGMGYEVAALVCRASAVEAPHQRERLFALAALAYGDGDGPQGEWAALLAGEQGSSGDQLDGCCGEASLWPPGPHDAERWAGVDPGLWPSVESPVRGVADGLPAGLGFRRQQLHALGNAVVPVQAAYAFVALANALTRSC
jgi:DNA (cytosine-5)-methyltransferase 1